MIDSVRELTQEDKDANHPYRAGALFTMPENVPSYYIPSEIENLPIWNQGEFEAGNDECGGCSAATVSGLQEGRPIDPHFHFMMARQRAGMKIEDYGVDNRSLAMALIDVGSLLKEDGPFTFQDGRNKIADPASWDIDKCRKKAILQKKGSVIWVKAEGPYDAFDVFRGTVTRLNDLYKKKHAAVFGLRWAYGPEARIEEVKEDGSGHDMAVIGWDGDYAVAMQSYGPNQGDNGKVRIHRSIVNRWAEVFGMPIFIDATQDEIKRAVAYGLKLDDNSYLNIMKAFVARLKNLLSQLKTVKGIMLWDTPAHIRRNVRVMCDEAGLSYMTKNTVCAIIRQESNWNPLAVNTANANGTTDRGLVQVNDHVGYHVGKGLYFETKEECFDPIKSTRFIISMAKAGRLNLWSSYKFGHYRKWLLSESRPSVPY